MSVHTQRARLLLNQSRTDMAMDELRMALGENPQDVEALVLMAYCLADKNQTARAVDHCRQAIELAPDLPFGYYTMGQVLHLAGRHGEAIEPTRRAIELDPYDADAFALLGSIHAARREWAKAIEATDQALEIDAEHTGASNVRAIALTRSGRRDEAGRTIDATLARNPSNPTTHANQGWALLHESKPREAMEHFAEALRLDPEHEWARAGIVEAMKARNILYRWLLRYMLWLSSLPPGAQIGLFVGIIVILQLMVRLPEDGPIFWTGIGLSLLYFGFVVTVWVAQPLFNLLLRIDRTGRMALTDAQRRDSNWLAGAMVLVGVFIVTGVVMIGRYFDLIDYLLLMIATGVTLSLPESNKNRRIAGGVTIGVFILATVYWYRWVSYGGPTANAAEFSRLLEAGNAAASAGADGFLELAQSQRTLNNIFSWGAIGLTWFAGSLHSRRG